MRDGSGYDKCRWFSCCCWPLFFGLGLPQYKFSLKSEENGRTNTLFSMTISFIVVVLAPQYGTMPTRNLRNTDISDCFVF